MATKFYNRSFYGLEETTIIIGQEQDINWLSPSIISESEKIYVSLFPGMIHPKPEYRDLTRISKITNKIKIRINGVNCKMMLTVKSSFHIK